MRLKRRINQDFRHLPAGVTLIETMISMAIFSIACLSLYAGIGSGFSTIGRARENLRATQIMLEKMETIRLYTFKQVNTPGFIPTTFSASYFPAGTETADTNTQAGSGLVYHGTLAIDDGPSNRIYKAYLKRITINLTWASGGHSHNRSMTTYITRYGLQNYIY